MLGCRSSFLLLQMLQCIHILFSSKVMLKSGLKLNVSMVDAKNGPHQHYIYLVDEKGDPNAVQSIDNFCKLYGLNSDEKIQLLEAALDQLEPAPKANDDPTLEVYQERFRITLPSANHSSLLSSRFESATNLLDATDYPLVIWTTATAPQYHIVLYGLQEFISQEIMIKGSFGSLDLLKRLVGMARSAGQSASAGVFVDVGANLGCYSLFAAALGEVSTMQCRHPISKISLR
jgi:hypothetical protein